MPPAHALAYLWPCNAPTWHLWHALQTQWRPKDFDGATEGLDYTSVLAYLRHVAGYSTHRIKQVFAELQAMECATLQAWAQMRAEKRR